MLLADPTKFTCAGCGGTFETDQEHWSDERAMAEMLATYGNIPEGQRELVCDDCYAKCMEIMAKEQGALQ